MNIREFYSTVYLLLQEFLVNEDGDPVSWTEIFDELMAGPITPRPSWRAASPASISSLVYFAQEPVRSTYVDHFIACATEDLKNCTDVHCGTLLVQIYKWFDLDPVLILQPRAAA